MIAASYSPKNIDVELFVRLETGPSATLLISGHAPFFFVELRPESEGYVRSKLSADPGVDCVSDVTLVDQQTPVRCLKVQIEKPFDCPKYRADFESMGLRTFASDIPFALRALCDLDIGAFIEFTGTQVAGMRDYYKTDEVWQAAEIKNVPAFDVPFKLLAFDCENRLGSDELYCISCYDGKNVTTFTGPDSWKKFQALILSLDPDILIGHNLVGYDLPLLDRNAGCDGLQIGRKWGRMQPRPKEAMMIPGRVVADSLVWAKRTISLERYSLGFASQKVLGRTKHDVKVQDMAGLWADETGGGRTKIISYCEQDTRLCFDLYQALGHLTRATMLSLAAKLPLQEVFYHKNGVILDRLAIPEFDKRNIAVPTNRRSSEVEGEIAGAYVYEPMAGLYGMVVVLDVSSMYPSAILQHNICPSSFVPPGTTTVGLLHEVRLTNQKGDDTGRVARFTDREDSVLPSIIRMLKQERAAAKKQLAASKVAGDDRRVLMWDSYQWGLKIIANAFYGLLASGFYRFTSPDIGNAITSTARATILNIIRVLKERGYDIVLSDTDSIGVALKDATLQQALETGHKLAAEFSAGEIQLELEKVMSPFFTHGVKKRYFGQMVWPENKRLERGYEVRRTDKFPLLITTQSRVMDLILADKSKEAIDAVLRVIDNVKGGAFDLQDLVISKSVDAEENYVNPESMIGVKIARKLKEARIPVFAGQKLSWVITDNEDGLRGEPLELWDDKIHRPCKEYYVDAISTTMGRILELFGWDEKSLARGMRQTGLADFEAKT